MARGIVINKTENSLFIIHFHPLEHFPPVINILNFLGKNAVEKIFVVSTKGKKPNSLNKYQSKFKNIEIKRTPAIVPGSAHRLINYLVFYLYSLLLLIKYRPKCILYYDTLSSWPALVYKKLRKRKVRLLAHYHEYTSPEGYKKNMHLVKWMHKWEIKMYPTAYKWISHTNEVRLEQFIKDHFLQDVDSEIFHSMPNYPSKFWATDKTKFGECIKTRLVYVGSLGYDNMYLQETIDWVLLNQEFLSLDFYAYNVDKKAEDLLSQTNGGCINYFGGCNYEELPKILKNYDVGLVMYKPYSYNTVNAVSNKVFEYLACGLDVWFSKDMTYTFSFIRENVYPKILPIDFTDLNNFDFTKALLREKLKFEPSLFYFEKVYEEIYKSMSSAI